MYNDEIPASGVLIGIQFTWHNRVSFLSWFFFFFFFIKEDLELRDSGSIMSHPT